MNIFSNLFLFSCLILCNYIYLFIFINSSVCCLGRDKESGGLNGRNILKSHIVEDSFNFGDGERTNVVYGSESSGISENISNVNHKRDKVTAKAILLCGGSGNRFSYDFSQYPKGEFYIPDGLPKSKQFVHIYNVPLFVYPLSELIHNSRVSEVVISSKPEWFSKILEMIMKSVDFISNYSDKMDLPGYSVDLIDKYLFDKITVFAYDFVAKKFVLDLNDIEVDDEARYKFVKFVESGPERCNSSYNALSRLEDCTNDEYVVLIHDGARPLLKLVDLDVLIETAVKYGACVPSYRATDTVKIVDGRTVSKTLDRSKTYMIQTPQAFKYGLIKDAYDNVMESLNYEPSLLKYFTDDSSILESQFKNVVIVEGHQFNLKVSYTGDLELCRFLIKNTLFTEAK